MWYTSRTRTLVYNVRVVHAPEPYYIMYVWYICDVQSFDKSNFFMPYSSLFAYISNLTGTLGAQELGG